MITDDVIEDLADSLFQQYNFIGKCYNVEDQSRYLIQLRDDTILMANVVHKHAPFYDMDKFYERAGYFGTAPRYN